MIGLSADAIDDVVDWIADLSGNKEEDEKAKDISSLPYALREDFLSAGEMAFYSTLKEAVSHHATICVKVRLADIFKVKGMDSSPRATYQNRINAKHVDFLLCDSQTMRPLVGIELDDKSHQRPDRVERDEFVDQVFATCKLPLVHIPARHSYAVLEIAAQLRPHLSRSFPQPIPSPVTSSPLPPSNTIKPSDKSAPICPNCGIPMVLRTKRTTNVGEQFWGCANYPKCRATRPYSHQ